MPEDILLTVGISLESLKKARQRVETELKTWPTHAPLTISPADQKSLVDTEKMTRAVTAEFSKLGTAIGKGKLSDYLKIDKGDATEAGDAFKKVGDDVSGTGDQFAKLSQKTEYYRLRNEAIGGSLKKSGKIFADVGSELNAYLRLQSTGVTLDEKSSKRKAELTQQYNKLAKEQQGLLHGLNIGRLMVWAIGWTAIYQTMRLVTNAIVNTIKGWFDFEKAMARVSTATQQIGMDHKTVIGAMGFAALDYSRKTTVAVTDVARVMYELGSAGLSAKEVMQGFEHVLALTVGTLGNVTQVSRLVASSYILFGDSITRASSISGKFQYISDVLAKVYAVHQVELSDIAEAFGYVGGAAALVNIKFEELVGTIGFLNDGLLRGSKAGTSLMEAFVSLGSKVDVLRENFGVVWDVTKPINFLEVMTQMKASIGDTVSSTIVFSQLMGVFGTRGARAIIQIMKRWDDFRDAINLSAKDVEGAAKKMQDIMESTVGGELEQLKNQFMSIATAFLEVFGPPLIAKLQNINKMLEGVNLYKVAEDVAVTVFTILQTIYDFVRNIILAFIHITKAAIDFLNTIDKISGAIRGLIPPLALYDAFKGNKEAKSGLDDLSKSLDRTFNGILDLDAGEKSLAETAEKLIIKIHKEEQAYKDLTKAQEMVSTVILASDLPKEKQITTLEKMYVAVEKSIERRVNLEGMNSDEYNIQVGLLSLIKGKIVAIKESEKSVVDWITKANRELAKGYNLDLLKTSGVSETVIKYQQFVDAIDESVYALKKTHPELNKVQLQIDVMNLSLTELAEKYENTFRGPDLKILKDFKKGWDEVLLTLGKEVKDLADEFQDVTTDFVKDMMKGTVDIKGFLKNIMDTYKDALADQLVGMFAEKTGMFANMASSFMSPLQKAHYTGIKNAVPMIIQAHIDGIKQALTADWTKEKTPFKKAEKQPTIIDNIFDLFSSKKEKITSKEQTTTGEKVVIDEAGNIAKDIAEKTSFSVDLYKAFSEEVSLQSIGTTKAAEDMAKSTGMFQTTVGLFGMKIDEYIAATAVGTEGKKGGGGGLLDTITGLFGGGKSEQYGVTGGKTGPPTQAQAQSQAATQKLSATMQKMGKVAGQVMSIASFGMEMADAYKYKGTGNPYGAAMSLATSGAIAGSAFGPIGTIVGGVVGGVYGFIQGARSKTTVETKRQTLEITSAIKISNKELQIVNRNLEGIRRGFEGYIHPRSAYFSERFGTEERFNLDRQRGIL